MKRYIYIFLCCLWSVSVSYGQSQSKSTLEFDDPVWDFGDIKEEGGTVSHVFKFTNKGSNAIVIENVSVSCGCTSPNYSKQPIKPGGRGEIKITFDPEHRPGRALLDAYIISNGSKNRNILTIKGNVIPRPRTVEQDYPFVINDGVRLNNLSVNFRYVQQNVPTSMILKYANTSDKYAKISFDISPDDGNIKISADENICAGCKGDITITSQIPDGKTYGKFVYRVFPVINGKRSNLPFSITGIATDDFSNVDKSTAPDSKISAYFHNFGDIRGAKKLEKDFIIYNNGKSPLVIRHVSGKNAISTNLKPGTTIQPGGELKIKCTLDTFQTNKGVVTEVLTIITNDPSKPMREIRLAANVEK